MALPKKLNEEEARIIEAAKTVRKWLSNGKIKAREFDMNAFGNDIRDDDGNICGTVHCIGGWMDVVLGGRGIANPLDGLDDVRLRLREAANNLFYPIKGEAFNSKRKSAVEAIDNFLDGKKDPWKGVDLSYVKMEEW